MDEKSKKYYHLWAEFLKISTVYARVVSAVASESQKRRLPDNFSDLDFSDISIFELWLQWIKDAEGSVQEIIKDGYEELLTTTYPFFQNIAGDTSCNYLRRIQYAHDRREDAKKEMISSGTDYLAGLIQKELSALESSFKEISVKEFAGNLIKKINSINSNKGRWKQIPNFVQGDDFFTVMLKIKLQGTRAQMREAFSSYINESNGITDEIFSYWDKHRRINVFMEVPPDIQIDASQKHLQFFKGMLSGMDVQQIIASNDNLYPAEEDTVRDGIEKAKSKLKYLEKNGVFLKLEKNCTFESCSDESWRPDFKETL